MGGAFLEPNQCPTPLSMHAVRHRHQWATSVRPHGAAVERPDTAAGSRGSGPSAGRLSPDRSSRPATRYLPLRCRATGICATPDSSAGGRTGACIKRLRPLLRGSPFQGRATLITECRVIDQPPNQELGRFVPKVGSQQDCLAMRLTIAPPALPPDTGSWPMPPDPQARAVMTASVTRPATSNGSWPMRSRDGPLRRLAHGKEQRSFLETVPEPGWHTFDE